MPVVVEGDAHLNDVDICEAILSRARGRIVFTGSNSKVTIRQPRDINERTHLALTIGSDAELSIDGDGWIGNISIYVHDRSNLRVGRYVTMNGLLLHASDGQSVTIGEDCMFADNVSIYTTDFHKIFDLETGERLNDPKPVTIGNHVWLGNGVTVLKGSEIGHGSAVGTRGVVAGKIPDNALAVGVPAKPIRHGISWQR